MRGRAGLLHTRCGTTTGSSGSSVPALSLPEDKKSSASLATPATGSVSLGAAGSWLGTLRTGGGAADSTVVAAAPGRRPGTSGSAAAAATGGSAGTVSVGAPPLELTARKRGARTLGACVACKA